MMGSLLFNEVADGPTMFFPPQQHAFQTSPFNHLTQSTNSFHYQNQSTSQWNSAAPTRPEPTPCHSKKRSRDSDDVDGDFLQAPREPSPRPEPVYGEGMTLIDPVSGRAVGSDSQTGTWYGDQLEESRKAAEAAAKEEAAYQARLPKAKRLNSQPALQGLPSQDQHSLFAQQQSYPYTDQESATDPLADLQDAEWLCTSTSDETRMASRGWAKFIEKSYPSLSNPEVLMTYREQMGSNGPVHKYIVVRTNQGFWRFSDDLRQAHEVALTWESCLSKLKEGSYIMLNGQVQVLQLSSADPTCESEEVLNADATIADGTMDVKASSAPEQWQPLSMGTGIGMGKRPLSGSFTALDRENVRSWRDQPGLSSWASGASQSVPTAFRSTFGEPSGYVSMSMDLD